MKKLNFKKPCIVDVGGCIGMYSVVYSNLYSSGKIYTFEPLKKNYEQLKKNLKFNKCNNVSVFNLGLSDKKKNTFIGIPDASFNKRYKSNINDGLYSIYSKKKTSLIKLDKLDHIIRKKKIKKVDFIKIDVEGAEYEVLKGSEKLIKKNHPVIQLEFNELTKKLGNKDIIYFKNFAKKFNYKIFYLVKNYKIKKKLMRKKIFFQI